MKPRAFTENPFSHLSPKTIFQFTLNLKLVLKPTGNVSLFAGNRKILPSNFLFFISTLFGPPNNTGEYWEFLIPQTTQERIQNFRSPKQHRRGFRISDSPKNKGRIQNFWSPKTTQERIQNFWSPKQHRRGCRISDPPNNTGEDSEFLIPQTTQEKIQNFWSPEQKYNTGSFSIFRNP